MNNIEILQKVIKKCGYNFPEIKNINDEIQEPILSWKNIDKFITEWLFDESYYQIIFSHDFAKCFWGGDGVGNYNGLDYWQYHLQKMVLEEEPLKYLEKFL